MEKLYGARAPTAKDGPLRSTFATSQNTPLLKAKGCFDLMIFILRRFDCLGLWQVYG